MNEIWRVEHVGEFNGKPLRHARWLNSKQAAMDYAAERQRKGSTEIKIAGFQQIDAFDFEPTSQPNDAENGQ